MFSAIMWLNAMQYPWSAQKPAMIVFVFQTKYEKTYIIMYKWVWYPQYIYIIVFQFNPVILHTLRHFVSSTKDGFGLSARAKRSEMIWESQQLPIVWPGFKSGLYWSPDENVLAKCSVKPPSGHIHLHNSRAHFSAARLPPTARRFGGCKRYWSLK